MSIFVGKNTRIMVQGITGKAGAFHTEQMIAYGSNVVAGISPDKEGEKFLQVVPIFDTVKKAVHQTGANASIIFVPAPYALDAILEASDAGLSLVVCITEGIPTIDMISVKEELAKSNTRLIGPNCPGIITPGECKMGIMPGFIHKKGPVGVVSRSGTLTYEAVYQLTKVGLGQSTCIGIGGDPIVGSSFIDVLEAFAHDEETKGIVMIGEIGGSEEERAAQYIKAKVNKPVVAFIAGQTAPLGKRMGHAGAIIDSGSGSAQEKIKVLNEAGIFTAKTPLDIGLAMKELL
jgi:succinyl-CoA synthetase alpha subunit